jgi:tellurite resistance-related uncharacterized protein
VTGSDSADDDPMKRQITGFQLDSDQAWLAALACGHQRHVRHDPPWQERAWIQHREERESRIGSDLDCALCDQREIPEHYVASRSTPSFNAESIPAGLRRRHQTKPGVWAEIRVASGALDYHLHAPFHETQRLVLGRIGIVLPGVEHDVAPCGEVSFTVTFFAREKT